jgi:outer membrane lipoprotein-sorting protein
MIRRIALILLTCTLAAPAQSPQLTKVLSQLDAASAKFHSAQADLRYDNYTKIVDDHDIQTGSLFIERTGSGEQMGAVFFEVQPSGQPSKSPTKILVYDGSTLQIDSPGVNQVDVFKAGANQAKYESFLTLGFGGSGRELAAQWNITDAGPETINGTKTEKLDLVSKDPAVRKLFTHVTIWIDLARGLSLRQVFYQPSGDARTADYTGIQENASINKKPYAIKKGANIIRH